MWSRSSRMRADPMADERDADATLDRDLIRQRNQRRQDAAQRRLDRAHDTPRNLAETKSPKPPKTPKT